MSLKLSLLIFLHVNLWLHVTEYYSSLFRTCLIKLYSCSQQPSGTETSVTMVVGTSSDTAWEYHLLTRGRAWAISLSQRSSISEEMLRICFSSNTDVIEESLLYRFVIDIYNSVLDILFVFDLFDA